MNYLEEFRLKLLEELNNKEITEDEFWEYYNAECADYEESYQAGFALSTHSW